MLVPLEKKLCKGEKQWFAGIEDNDIYSLLDKMRETAKQLAWPVKAYQPPQNVADYKLKVRLGIALLHGVYDLTKCDVISPVIFINPEPPRISIEMNAEILGDSLPTREGVTIELPVDYMQIIFAQSQQRGQIMDLKLMKPGQRKQPVMQPTITAASQIPILQPQQQI